MVRQVGLVAAIVFAATSATAETPEQRQACTDDAFQYCGDAIPDRDRVFNCLIAKRAQISPLCVAGLAPYLPAEPVPVATKKTAKPAAKPAAKPKPAARTAAKPKPAAKPQKGPLALSPSGR